jgi:hypothetical protein
MLSMPCCLATGRFSLFSARVRDAVIASQNHSGQGNAKVARRRGFSDEEEQIGQAEQAVADLQFK